MYPRNSAQQRQPSAGGRSGAPPSGPPPPRSRVPTSYSELMENDDDDEGMYDRYGGGYNGGGGPPPPRHQQQQQQGPARGGGGLRSGSGAPPSQFGRGGRPPSVGGGGVGYGRSGGAAPSNYRRTSGAEDEARQMEMSANTMSAIRNGGVAIRNNLALSPGGRVRRSTNSGDDGGPPPPRSQQPRYGHEEENPYGGGGGGDTGYEPSGGSDAYHTLGGVGGGGGEPMDTRAVLDAYQALEEMPVGGGGGGGRSRNPPPQQRQQSTTTGYGGRASFDATPANNNSNIRSGGGGGGALPPSVSRGGSRGGGGVAPLRPSSRGLGSVATRGAGRTPSASSSSISMGRGRSTPQNTVGMLNNEHRVTAKGRVLQGAVDDMHDMYYGAGGEKDPRGASKMPAIGGGGRRYEDEDTDERLLAKVTGRGGGDIGGGARTSRAVTMEAVMNPTSWIKGPSDTEGRVYDASDRNLLCMDVQGKNAVVGSADHGLKVFDITTMREKRKLYGKTCGHSEWVTTVAYLKDGRILSGGMDSKLCLWHASAPRCTDLLGHTGSISQVATNEHGIAISAGYDRTLRVWDCGAGGSQVGTMTGHNQPVTMFDWTGPMLLSGDRRGTVKVWDVETNKCAATHATKHGQIGSLGNLLIPQQNDHLSFVGDQGGVVSIFDFRQSGNTPIFAETLHPGGVVSGLKGMNTVDGDNIGGLIVTCGADRQIHVLEPRMSFSPLHSFKEHKDFIYSMETFGGRFILSGGGNGWLLVHDIKTGKCCYGLGANAAAVRNIFATNSHLVCAGDDGKATVYDF